MPVTSANAGVLWEVLQEPDLRDYQDLPDVDRAQFLRVVASRPARLGPGIAGVSNGCSSTRPAAEASRSGGFRCGSRTRAARLAEIGYSVVRAHRCRGIATEAVAALVEEGFRRARLRAIRAYCLPENLSSRAVLRHNGFDDEGTLPRGATVQGKPVDVIVHSLDRRRWAAAVSANPAATRS